MMQHLCDTYHLESTYIGSVTEGFVTSPSVAGIPHGLLKSWAIRDDVLVTVSRRGGSYSEWGSPCPHDVKNIARKTNTCHENCDIV